MSALFESGAFAEKGAWHDLGVVVDHAMSAEEALVVGGLNWDVVKVPQKNSITGETLEDFFQTIRTTDNKVLGSVGTKYHVMQNREAFRILDSLLKEGLKYEAVTSLKEGRIVTLLARLPHEIKIGESEKERIIPYILLANSHDGSFGIRLALTPVRVVCCNTLRAAIENADDNMKSGKIKHTINFENKILEAGQILLQANKYFESFKATAEKLISSSFTTQEMENLLKKLYSVEKTQEVSKQTETKFNEIMANFNYSANLEHCRNTKWAAYNAVTEYIDHQKSYHNPESKMIATWVSSQADEVRDKTLQLLKA